MKYTRKNRGSATILIMLMTGVIITVGLGFNWLVKEHIKSSEGLKNKAAAIMKARSAYDTLIYLMLNGRPTQKELALFGVQDLTTLQSLPLNGREVTLADDIYVKVQDSNGLLSLSSSISAPAIERLLRNVGQVENTAIPLDSFLDWIDADNLSRVNGAEKSHYNSQQLPYQTRNYALQYKEEMMLMRGIGRDVYRKIDPYLTILPATGFNPNTASDAILKAYLDINDESLIKLKDYMSVRPISSDTELFLLTGRRLLSSTWDETLYYYPSRFMEIMVKVGSPRSLYTIKAGLNFVRNPNSPYSVVYWQEL